MTTGSAHRRFLRLVDAHFEGRIAPRHEQQMRAHLDGCADCRAYYQRWLTLAQLDPGVPSARDRLATGLGVAAPRAGRGSTVAWSVAAAAALALLVVKTRDSGEKAAFVSRGGAQTTADLLVYRIADGKSALLAPLAPIKRKEELAFSYQNEPGWRQLMVFAVDEHKHVFWYYPAWIDPAQNPGPIGIQKTGGPTELPEAVTHRIDGQQLQLFAVFTHRKDLNVRAIEQIVSHPDTDLTKLSLPGAVIRTTALRVQEAP